jgi:hypothetical protein
VISVFLGSGTTAIAALKTGRNVYGIEIDQNQLLLAEERIKRFKGSAVYHPSVYDAHDNGKQAAAVQHNHPAVQTCTYPRCNLKADDLVYRCEAIVVDKQCSNFTHDHFDRKKVDKPVLCYDCQPKRTKWTSNRMVSRSKTPVSSNFAGFRGGCFLCLSCVHVSGSSIEVSFLQGSSVTAMCVSGFVCLIEQL